jgi:hypothetical protein
MIEEAFCSVLREPLFNDAQALLVRRLEFDRRIRAVAKGLVLPATTTAKRHSITHLIFKAVR